MEINKKLVETDWAPNLHKNPTERTKTVTATLNIIYNHIEIYNSKTGVTILVLKIFCHKLNHNRENKFKI